MMGQYGFFFDQSRCMGCHDCAVACKCWHGLPAGPLKYLKIYEYEKGRFPDIRVHFQWVPCYHCEEPACVSHCPTGAMYKEANYGAVLIDSEKCVGCRSCYDVCPYGAPVFESDEAGMKAQKCTLCSDRLELGEKPICVLTCSSRALDFGPLTTLMTKYGVSRDLEDLPGSRTTQPAVVFKAHTKKRKLVPYDTEKALELLARRDPLPLIFTAPTDVTEIPSGMVARNELVIKHESAAQLLRYTRNDEG
jgi:anaerobic dimethyl sulfoxide reductase subunit B (iron-sulfur subunit)